MTSKNRFMYLIVTILIVSVLSACGNSNDGQSTSTSAPSPSAQSESANTASNEDGYRLLTDALGNEVKVPNHPQRIIASFLEDPLTALGMKPVAQWGYKGAPQHYLQDKLGDVPVLNVDGGLKSEETLSYNPDLIIFLSPSYLRNGDYEQFAKIAPTFVLSDNDSDWRGNLQKLGALLGKEDAANQALADYDKKLSDAKKQLGDTLTDKTAILLQGGDEKGYNLFGPGFFGGAMLYDSFGFKAPSLINGSYETYSLETLPQLKEVDYIFVLSGEGRAKPPEDNPLWQELPAVKSGNVFAVDSGHWFNANPIANGLVIDDIVRYIHE
ncbi:ABC transporter substrate-binding protein [Paenibacillus sp. GCM10012306]|uniref:ABC transporter substrate-binding protein n=1 Tax=Paenibacillus sp. GCM10012306 TaxID=3317342 RepID=UPI0036224845